MRKSRLCSCTWSVWAEKQKGRQKFLVDEMGKIEIIWGE